MASGIPGHSFPVTVNAGDIATDQMFADTGASIANLWTGGYSFAKLLVDGIGLAAVSLAAGEIARITGGFISLLGTATDSTPAVVSDTTPTTYRFLWKIKLAANHYARIYAASNGYIVTDGAEWNGTAWVRDSAVSTSFRYRWDAAGYWIEYNVAGSPHTDVWSNLAGFSASGLSVGVGNFVQAVGNISSTLGSVSAGTSIAAATTVTGGTGVTATTGDVISVAGNSKARHFIGNTTSNVPVLSTPAPGLASAVVTAGSDAGFLVTVTVGGPAITTALNLFTIAYANTYTNRPALVYACDGKVGPLYTSSASATGFVFNVDCTTVNLAGGGSYTFSFIPVGY